jgi:LCP family protein required for cell wall assembly
VTRTTRSFGLLAGGILMSGILIAGLLTAAWAILGSPNPAGATWMQVTRVGASYTGGEPTEPFYFLALGNDGRTDAEKGLGDAIHVIGINPALKQGTMLNVPRDTTAPSGDKINAYHSLEGLPGIIRELNQMMGIQINYAITTNFPGFIEMVNTLGGIEIDIPMPLNDTDSGAVFPVPGTILATGDMALGFSRDRKDFTAGDIDRSYNQGTIILSALRTIKAKSPDNAETMKMIAILARHVRMENVGMTELFRLGKLALTLDPANIKNITIPVGGGSATSTNLSIGGDGPALFADFADDAVVQSR